MLYQCLLQHMRNCLFIQLPINSFIGSKKQIFQRFSWTFSTKISSFYHRDQFTFNSFFSEISPKNILENLSWIVLEISPWFILQGSIKKFFEGLRTSFMDSCRQDFYRNFSSDCLRISLRDFLRNSSRNTFRDFSEISSGIPS